MSDNDALQALCKIRALIGTDGYRARLNDLSEWKKNTAAIVLILNAAIRRAEGAVEGGEQVRAKASQLISSKRNSLMTEREKIVEVMARGQYAANCWWRPVEDDDDATGRYKAGHDGDLFRAIEWGQLCEDERKELLDAASAALTALKASGRAVVQGWQSIESAPDTSFGRPVPVLVFGERTGVCFGDLHRIQKSPVVNVAHLGGDAIADWGVTHFMPLPAPPASPTPSMTENADE